MFKPRVKAIPEKRSTSKSSDSTRSFHVDDSSDESSLYPETLSMVQFPQETITNLLSLIEFNSIKDRRFIPFFLHESLTIVDDYTVMGKDTMSMRLTIISKNLSMYEDEEKFIYPFGNTKLPIKIVNRKIRLGKNKGKWMKKDGLWVIMIKRVNKGIVEITCNVEYLYERN